MTAQTTVEDEVARFRAALTDRETAAREWQRRAEEESRTLRRVRFERDRLKEEIAGLRSALTETYAHWRDARNAELLLVRNDLEEARRTNRNLLEDYHNLAGRLSQSEGEAAHYCAALEDLLVGAEQQSQSHVDVAAKCSAALAHVKPSTASIYCPATTDHKCGRTDCVGAVCRMVEGAL